MKSGARRLSRIGTPRLAKLGRLSLAPLIALVFSVPGFARDVLWVMQDWELLQRKTTNLAAARK